MRRATVTVIAATVVALSGCTSTTASQSGKYDQTWPKSYGDTTCSEWTADMDQHEMWVAAADMLTGARDADDEGSSMPADSLVDEFRDGVTTACVVPTMTLAEVGAALYLTERTQFKP